MCPEINSTGFHSLRHNAILSNFSALANLTAFLVVSLLITDLQRDHSAQFPNPSSKKPQKAKLEPILIGFIIHFNNELAHPAR